MTIPIILLSSAMFNYNYLRNTKVISNVLLQSKFDCGNTTMLSSIHELLASRKFTISNYFLQHVAIFLSYRLYIFFYKIFMEH